MFFVHGKEETGSMTTIITIAARIVTTLPLSKKNNGKSVSSATAKKISSRFVGLKATFVKSLGTGTYAK